MILMLLDIVLTTADRKAHEWIPSGLKITSDGKSMLIQPYPSIKGHVRNFKCGRIIANESVPRHAPKMKRMCCIRLI